MKSLKLIGISLLALIALGAFAASAFAEAGFLEKPEKATVLGGESVLETGAGAPIICALLDDSTITFSNNKHAKGTLHWLKCKILGLDAHSLGGGPEEILVPILFLVCLEVLNVNNELIDAFGIYAEVEGSPTHIEAPALGALVLVRGGVIGAVLTSGKATLFNVEFLGEKGKQVARDCKDGAELKDHTLEASTNEGKTYEVASEKVTGGLVTFSTAVELMDS